MNAAKKNTTLALNLLMVVAGMTALSFASVPLYRLFCQVTGFGGTVQQAEAGVVETVIDRPMTILFNADIDSNLPWDFTPDQRKVEVQVGKHTLVSYTAHNRSNKPVTGNATFNVTPNKAGIYFSKIECFCFTEQTLQPGEKVNMPISFYIDPKITQDKNLDDVGTITLSYTFFAVKPE